MDEIQKTLVKAGRVDLAQQYFERVAKDDRKKFKNYYENIKNIASDSLKQISRGIDEGVFIWASLNKIEDNIKSIRQVAKANKIQANKVVGNKKE